MSLLLTSNDRMSEVKRMNTDPKMIRVHPWLKGGYD